MAQAAKAYVTGLLTVANANGVKDLTQATHLTDLGNKNLTAAQTLQTSNPDQAVKDLLLAMKDYRDAAKVLQAQLVDVLRDTIQADELTGAWVRHRARAEKLEGILAQVCPSFPSNSLCSDARNSLNMAESELANAKAAISSTPRDTDTAANALADAAKLLGQARSDIAQIADATRSNRAVDFVQKLQHMVAEVQAMANSLPANSPVKGQVTTQLNTVSTDLTNAGKAFQSGDFKTGIDLVQQAMQLLQQTVVLIRQNTPHA